MMSEQIVSDRISLQYGGTSGRSASGSFSKESTAVMSFESFIARSARPTSVSSENIAA